MAKRRILRIDNSDDYKVLTSRAQEMELPAEGLRALADDMIETMHAADGVGLAAPQIGLLQRLIVIFLPDETPNNETPRPSENPPGKHYVLVNPEIVKSSAHNVEILDGCLSLPGWYGRVPRARWVTVEYQDLDGTRRRIRKAEGLLSYALQHEIDHLNGVLFTTRISDLSTFKFYGTQSGQM